MLTNFKHYLKMKVKRTFKEKVVGHCNLFVVSLNTIFRLLLCKFLSTSNDFNINY